MRGGRCLSLLCLNASPSNFFCFALLCYVYVFFISFLIALFCSIMYLRHVFGLRRRSACCMRFSFGGM